MASEDDMSGGGFEEPSFAVHSPFPVKGVGRIIGIRYQDACIDDFSAEDVRVINSGGGEASSSGGFTVMSAQDTAALMNATDPSCPVSVVFIERAAEEGLATITHAYTPVPTVAQYLSSTRDAVLSEDAAFLSFLIAGGSDATSSLLLRSGFHKRLKPVHEENRRLKAEMKMLRLENLQLKSTIANHYNNSTNIKNQNSTVASGGGGLHTSDGTSSAAAAVPVPRAGNSTSPYRTVEPPSHNFSGLTNTASDNDAAIALHSPHQWEMETEAAINARTRYNPYRDEASRAKRRANRHKEALAQLVARLHDKSCDDRDRRLASYDAVIQAENERYNEKKTLDSEEQRALGTRLHDLSSSKKKKMLEQLEHQYYPPVERRTFDSEAIKKSNERIYREPMEKKQKGLEKLIQTYVYDRDAKLPSMKLSREQQEAMADRLSQPNKQ